MSEHPAMPAARVGPDGLLERCCWQSWLDGMAAGRADALHEAYAAGWAACEEHLAAIQRRAHEVVTGLSRDPVLTPAVLVLPADVTRVAHEARRLLDRERVRAEARATHTAHTAREVA